MEKSSSSKAEENDREKIDKWIAIEMIIIKWNYLCTNW